MGPHFLSLCQIWCESVQKWASYGLITDFKIAAATILDFCTMWILMVNLAARPYFQPMFQIWCKFTEYVSNSVKIYAKMAEIWPKVADLWLKVWFSTWRPPPSWILQNINFAGKTSHATPFFVSTSNLVSIRLTMAELWPFNWFQNGGRRHLGFLAYVNFDCKSLSLIHIWRCRRRG